MSQYWYGNKAETDWVSEEVGFRDVSHLENSEYRIYRIYEYKEMFKQQLLPVLLASISLPLSILFYIKRNFPMNPYVGRSVCHNVLKGREVSLPCSAPVGELVS